MERVNFQTKSDIIYQELKNDIISGKYKPDERIVISEIAKEFGTSDIPVREAIKRLEFDGLVKITPYVGAVVTDFDIEDMKKIFHIRSLLEGLATNMASQEIKKEDLTRLGKIIDDLEIIIRKNEYDHYSPLNREFHDIIYSASGNEYLRRIIFELWDLSVRSRAIFAFVPERASDSVREHKDILKALKKRDGALAEKRIVKHMENSLSSLQLYFERVLL